MFARIEIRRRLVRSRWRTLDSQSRRHHITRITKTVRLTGSSADSIEDAVRTVLARAAMTIADISRWDLVRAGGQVDDSGVPTAFEVTIDITFGIREAVEHG